LLYFQLLAKIYGFSRYWKIIFTGVLPFAHDFQWRWRGLYGRGQNVLAGLSICALRNAFFHFSLGTIMKTFVAKPHEVKRDWFVIDAKGKVLGRVASEVARRLRGKHKPEFTPHVDTGDYIVVVNAADIVVTGAKAQDKRYYRHSTYPGGITETNFEKMQQRFPGRALQKAVKGMLPKGPLGYAMAKKLKVYAGAEHPHVAQQPQPLDI